MEQDIFQKLIQSKIAERERKQLALKNKEISPIELARKNFCMKGADLKAARNPDGSFSLFK